ncbi:MAG: hypothetical protein FWE50_03230 [Alphaproteobacteria bacterium]|nr:hypothetical protein [Alphaproteobacteria bacterium]
MMATIQQQYRQQLEKQLPIVCSQAIGAYLDSCMFMYPDAVPKLQSNTHLFLYSYYAIRNRAILSAKKLIEPAGKSKVNLDSIVKIITKPDCDILQAKQKQDLTDWFNNIQKSEHGVRLKNFRDAIAHNMPDGDKAMIIYNDLKYTVSDAMDILERLYIDVFGKMPHFFDEIGYISKILVKDYWETVDKAAKKAPVRTKELARLSQLLQLNLEP